MLRLAGKALQSLVKDIPKEELVLRLGQDALGGAMAAAYTPGDLGDKLIAGAASTVGGAAGGLALGRLGGPGIVGVGLDMAGSIGGDIALSRLGEEGMKAKSYAQGEGYRTPWDKMSDEQQEILAAQIQKDVLRQYGLAVPGAPIQYALAPDATMQVLGG